MATFIKALYQYQVYFKLIIEATEYLIEEPTGWDAVKLDLPRDDDYYGFVAEFFKDDIQLGFADDDVAYDLIKNVYKTKGQDGIIGFEVGFKDPDTLVNVPLFNGNLNLNIYADENNEIKTSIERVSFETLFRSRFDTQVDFSSGLSLDNLAIALPPMKTTTLHSKSIIKEFASEVVTPQEFQTSAARFVSVKMDSANETVSELSGNQALPLSVSGLDPRDESLYFFQAPEAGIYDMKFQASFNMRIATIHIGNWYLVPRLIIQRGDSTISEEVFNAFRRAGGTSSSQVYFTMDFNISTTKTLQVGDKIYLDCFGVQQYAGTTYVYFIDSYTGKNSIVAQTTAAPSTTSSYLLFDVLNYLLNATTGQTNALIAPILEPGGSCHDYVLANGYQIRNFTASNKPFITSLKDYFEGVFSILGLGYGFRLIGGKEFVVVQQVSDFFQMVEIMLLDEIHDYKEEHGKKFVFNEAEFGFEKYPEENTNTLDEFNTFKNVLTPTRTYKAKFSKKSKIIASGYLLEEQRREQFSENPSESLTNDDNPFIVSVVPNGLNYDAEKNENFENIDGIFSPETAYNLRISPSRIEYNWSPILNIGLARKLDADLIKTTFIKNNDKLKSSLKAADPRRRFEPSSILEEKGDISLSTFRAGIRKGLHLPELASFKSIVDFTNYVDLKECLTGNSATNRNYGFIVHVDDEGVRWKSFVYSVSYEMGTREATFLVAKIELY